LVEAVSARRETRSPTLPSLLCSARERRGEKAEGASDERSPVHLLDNFVGPHQHRLRDRQSERLGRLHVDYEVKLHRLLDGEVSRLDALKDLVHLGSDTPVQLG
jgi:hypothetical protein